jgi:nucleotide-binding universal stress UspA family protein
MKTIVVTTDFTPISQNAVDYAIELALFLQMRLSILHVNSIPLSFSEVPSPIFDLIEMQSDAEIELARLKENIIEETGGLISVETHLRVGDVVSEINDYCNAVKPYVVIIGAESANAFEKFLFAGKAISALRQLAWPLIVVPPAVRFSNIRRVALACDCKDVISTLPLSYIKTLVSDLHAQLQVVHIAKHDHDSSSLRYEKEFEWLKNVLKGTCTKYHVLHGEHIEECLTEFAEKNKIDLMIVIPKKYNLLRDLFRHSHSQNLVLHTHVPVMAVH